MGPPVNWRRSAMMRFFARTCRPTRHQHCSATHGHRRAPSPPPHTYALTLCYAAHVYPNPNSRIRVSPFLNPLQLANSSLAKKLLPAFPNVHLAR
jgi:hypothetical protein